MPAPTGYSRLQIALHWLVALVVAAQFVFHDAISAAWRALRDGTGGVTDPMVLAHVAGGALVGVLVLWRLALRLRRGVPSAPAADPAAVRRLAGIAHWSLYALLLALTATGLAAWFGGVGEAAEVHEAMTTALLALVGLHVGAALLHRSVTGTDVLVRMRRPSA